jgi:hypothetical protein
MEGSVTSTLVSNRWHKYTKLHTTATPCVGNFLLNHITEGKTEEKMGWEKEKEDLSC